MRLEALRAVQRTVARERRSVVVGSQMRLGTAAVGQVESRPHFPETRVSLAPAGMVRELHVIELRLSHLIFVRVDLQLQATNPFS